MVPSAHGTGDPYARLLEATREARTALVRHRVYGRVNHLLALRIFMTNHAFGVLDFMTLVKALQVRLTCVTTPWVHPPDRLAARFINEIVLGEETDEVEPGVYMSHYELYLDAMEEVGANTAPVRRFEAALRSAVAPAEALVPLPVPESTKRFVEYTMQLCASGATHEIAAAFLLGREDIVPEMFQNVLAEMEAADIHRSRWRTRLRDAYERLPRVVRPEPPAALRRAVDAVFDRSGPDPRRTLRLYLQRHIELDGGEHGPMSVRLLRTVCGDDQRKWDEATTAANVALWARVALWDGVCASIDAADAAAHFARVGPLTGRHRGADELDRAWHPAVVPPLDPLEETRAGATRTGAAPQPASSSTVDVSGPGTVLPTTDDRGPDGASA